MPSLRLYVSETTQARLNALAPSYGGRAALLRVLLERAVLTVDPLPPPKGRPMRTFVRLSPEETEAVIIQAASRGLKASTWIRTLVRRRVFGEPRFLRSEELALFAIHDRLVEITRELRRLGQPHPSADDDEWVQCRMAVENAQRGVREAVEGLRGAFRGNLAYWAAHLGEEAHDGL